MNMQVETVGNFRILSKGILSYYVAKGIFGTSTFSVLDPHPNGLLVVYAGASGSLEQH
jgi:hypothetical protein